jgi:hypothetical protein
VFEYWQISGTISCSRSATAVSLTWTYTGDVGVVAYVGAMSPGGTERFNCNIAVSAPAVLVAGQPGMRSSRPVGFRPFRAGPGRWVGGERSVAGGHG